MVNESSGHGIHGIADVERRDAAAILGCHDDEDVADGLERPCADSAVGVRRDALDPGGVRRIRGVDDVDAVVRGADVDGASLPGESPNRLGEISVVDARKGELLQMHRRARVGDVPGVDATTPRRDHVEATAVLGERNGVRFCLALGFGSAGDATIRRDHRRELPRHRHVRNVVNPVFFVAADHEIAVHHRRLAEVMTRELRGRDQALRPAAAGKTHLARGLRGRSVSFPRVARIRLRSLRRLRSPRRSARPAAPPPRRLRLRLRSAPPLPPAPAASVPAAPAVMPPAPAIETPPLPASVPPLAVPELPAVAPPPPSVPPVARDPRCRPSRCIPAPA